MKETRASQAGALLYVLMPRAAHAAGTTFASWTESVVAFVDSSVIPVLYALLFLLFVFGIFRYFFTGGEENRQQGRSFLLWTIIGFVAVFSVWGIVNLLLSALSF